MFQLEKIYGTSPEAQAFLAEVVKGLCRSVLAWFCQCSVPYVLLQFCPLITPNCCSRPSRGCASASTFLQESADVQGPQGDS